MTCNWLTPKAHTVAFPGRGWGSVALEPIAAGEMVTAFGGELVTLATLRTLPQEHAVRSLQIEADLFLLSPEEPDPGDYVNHSCEPNCGMDGAVVLVAMRDIEPGEELTFDYAMCDVAPYSEFDCACRAATCRGEVRHDDWRRPELIERYRGYHSTYVAKCIAALEAESISRPPQPG